MGKNGGKVKFDFSKAEDFSSNIINIYSNGEDVFLSFGIKEKQNDNGEIFVSHRVMMTIPHFLRTYELFKDVVADWEKKGVIERLERQKQIR